MSEYSELKEFVVKVYEYAENPVEVLAYAKTIDCFLDYNPKTLTENIELAIKVGFDDEIEEFHNRMQNEPNFVEMIELAMELGFEDRAKEFVDKMESEYDFEIENFRFISKNRIDDIAYDYAIDLIEDVYIDSEMRKSWLYKYFDIDAAAKDFVSDGYGHLFGSYDGGYDEFQDYIYMRVH